MFIAALRSARDCAPVVLGAVLALLGPVPAGGQTVATTYQGELSLGGALASGEFDLRFTLFDQPAGGTAVSPTACAENTVVAAGRFTVVLPFAVPSTGRDSFLEIQVRAGSTRPCTDVSGYTTLTPRQRLTPAPIATFASAVTSAPPVLPGAIRFNPATGQFEGCDGLFWYPFQLGAPVIPANIQTFSTSGTHTFVVPPGVTRLGVDLWGGGGGGGPRPGGIFFVAQDCGDDTGLGGAGGGGSGAFVRANVAVTPGESLTIVVGSGGSVNALGSQSAPGGSSRISRGSTTLLRVLGGQGGLPGVPNLSIPVGTTSCSGLPSGAPGGAGTVDAVSGTVLVQSPGNAGTRGVGPACRVTMPNFCQGSGGAGGGPVLGGAPLANLVAGRGGDGADANANNATPGNTGAARLFWN